MKQFSIILFLLLSAHLDAQNIELETFATGFNDPINIKSADDDRLFVVERAGLIQIIQADGTRNITPFLDINSIVIDGGGESGLLGLAFHPNYASNGYFYINYINNSGNTVISRFTSSDGNADIADSTSELQILTYEQPFGNHNGGDMAFGADGFLYISSGDGGDSGDPGNRAQSLNTLLGKLLRIDVDNSSSGNNYAIPSDNPFFGSTTAMPEIWAYGLRNPWKFSFDRDTNDLWLADVGQDQFEEINKVSSSNAGVNYGWRCYEGNATYNQSSNCPSANTLKFPLAVYSHFNDGLFKCSITGGYVYRGTAQANLEGIYFFADYCSGEIGMLKQIGNTWNMSFSTPFENNNWTTFGQDNDGELYIAGIESGTIFKIVQSTLSVEELNTSKIKIFPNPSDEHLTIEVANDTNIQNIKIYDIRGKLVLAFSNFHSNRITISTKDLMSGVYFAEITDTIGNSVTQKLIKD